MTVYHDYRAIISIQTIVEAELLTKVANTGVINQWLTIHQPWVKPR